MGRLRILALVTSALMIGAAINEALAYILFALDHPGSGSGSQAFVSRIRMVSGFALLPIAIGGLWLSLPATGGSAVNTALGRSCR